MLQTFRFSTGEAIDWPGIRAVAKLVGVREAARQAAADLPADERKRFVERAMKRCQREKWLAPHPATLSADVSVPAESRQAKPLSANVRTGAETAEAVLSRLAAKGRLGAARYVARVLPHAARLAKSDSDRALASASDVKAAAGVAAVARLPGWTEKHPLAVGLVNIAILGVHPDQLKVAPPDNA